MGFLDNATDRLISSNVLKYTGQSFTPTFRCPVRSSVSLDWDGWAALDQKSLWLVNKYGARGILTSNILEYSKDSPSVIRIQTTTGNLFAIYPKTITGGNDLLNYLNFVTDLSVTSHSAPRQGNPSAPTKVKDVEDTSDFKIDKFCDSCSKIVPMAYSECAFCKGTSFTHKKNFNYQSGNDGHSRDSYSIPILGVKPIPEVAPLPTMKVCPMCAEDIKYAAKKCRYCGTMLSDQLTE